MISENFNNNLKIFVRYPPGGSGHFISCLILSLVSDVTLHKLDHYHNNVDDINQGHNFHTQWSENFKQHTKENIDLESSVSWIRHNFRFHPIPTGVYVVHTHAINPLPLMLAFDNTKLLNICITDNDKDQIYFNWITKSVYLYSEQWDLVNRALVNLQTKHNRLQNIMPGTINKSSDLRLVTYIRKYGSLNDYNFVKPMISNLYDVYNINFSDIANKKIIGLLDEIINFLGIKITDKRKADAIQMINAYADAQKVVPWKLNLEDYD